MPYEAYHGRKPDVGHLKEFGCDVWVLNEAAGRSKLEPRGLRMIFVGIMEGAKAVRYYDAKMRNIKVSRNVAFMEKEELKEVVIPALSFEEETRTPALNDLPKQEGEPQHRKSSTIPSRSTTPVPSTNAKSESKPSTSLHPSPTITTRSLRPRTVDIDYHKADNPAARNVGERFKEKEKSKPQTKTAKRNSLRKDIQEDILAMMEAEEEGSNVSYQAFMGKGTIEQELDEEAPLPRSVEEALEGEEAEMWKAAIEEELGNHKVMGTWRLEDLPMGREAIGNRWVFARKRDDKGNVVRYKARLVAQGFSQKPGIDFDLDSTFAPVMRLETLRTVLALAATNRWSLFQSDVKSAYLNGRITEEIFMRQPAGFDGGSGRVCRLQRSLYGLKQAGNIWNREFNETMRELGFQQLKTDPCCYVRFNNTSLSSILLLWVDDILGAVTTSIEGARIHAELSKKFKITTTHQPGILLGMKITRDDTTHSISISQTHYIDAMLKRYGLQDANPVNTPLDPNVNLDSIDPPSEANDTSERASGLYATAIGSLLYAAMGTRPDIAYAVHRLAQFTRSPQPKHWTAVKRVLRYLKGTRTLYLTFGGLNVAQPSEILTFCDADWASNADRKSISGYVVMLAGGAIAWSSKKQTSVALLTAEAEYIAATHAAKQVLWYRSLFSELGISQPSTSTIFTDNQAAIAIAHHPEFHARTKHIDIALHFLRDHVQSKTLNTAYVNTRDNLADIFTKGLPRPAHQDFTSRLGLLPLGCTTKEEC